MARRIAKTYILRPGDSLERVSFIFTGSPYRAKELVAANPRQAFAKGLRVGQRIFIPANWPAAPQRPVAPLRLRYAGTVGQISTGDPATDELISTFTDLFVDGNGGGGSDGGGGGGTPAPASECSPGIYTGALKDYVIIANNSLPPYDLAKTWHGTGANALAQWHQLRAANYDDPNGFRLDTSQPVGQRPCVWKVWGGTRLKVPASWPDPPPGSPLWGMTEKVGGTTTTDDKKDGNKDIIPTGDTETFTDTLTEYSPWLLAGLGLVVGATGLYVASKVSKKR